MIPDKIYVPQRNIEVGNIQELGELIVTGSIEYIRKDTLIEWAKEQMTHYPHALEGIGWGQLDTFRQVIDKIESL